MLKIRNHDLVDQLGKLLLDLASAFILGSTLRETYDHIITYKSDYLTGFALRLDLLIF
jgi:hypothetical protein